MFKETEKRQNEKKERKSIQVVGINIPFRPPFQELISSWFTTLRPKRISCLKIQIKKTTADRLEALLPRKRRAPVNAQNSKAPVRENND